MRQLLLFALLISPTVLPTARAADTLDALLAKVGREAVLLSDLQRFHDVSDVLSCAGVIKRENPLDDDKKSLLSVYVEEELMYQEARSRKLSTAGLIPEAVKAIQKTESCQKSWRKLGEQYSKIFRTETRLREGESLLVRELEKRVLVEKFKKTEAIADGELWKREAKGRYPVKVYLE